VTAISVRPSTDMLVRPAPSVRMSLKPATEIRGKVDGAWWPRSDDLADELPPLVAVLDQLWGRITRVTVHEGMWPKLPAKVRTGLHTVRLGWFDAEQSPHDLCLFSYSVGRWDLLVIPPECDPSRADRLMAAASDVHNTQSSGDLIAEATPLTGASAASGTARTPAVAPEEVVGASPLRANAARVRVTSWPKPVDPDNLLIRT
jgi:Family of unknown function (DUF5994)